MKHIQTYLQKMKYSPRYSSFVSALLRKHLIDFFQNKKNISISPYLLSIRYKNGTFYIKVKSSLLKNEILLYQKEITELFEEKYSLSHHSHLIPSNISLKVH